MLYRYPDNDGGSRSCSYKLLPFVCAVSAATNEAEISKWNIGTYHTYKSLCDYFMLSFMLKTT